MSEHEFEPVPGLPEHLPKDERLLWQGQPHWRPLAMRAFRLREVMIYFALLMVWQVVSGLSDGSGALVALQNAISLVPLALAAVALLIGLAYASAQTTLYSITDRRIVLRIGMALPVTLNIPFAVIDGAGVATYRDGSGDIAMQLRKDDRLAYLVLWPHVRPWRYTRPEPMLRGIANSQEVAELLSNVLAGASAKPIHVSSSTVAQDLRGNPAPLAS